MNKTFLNVDQQIKLLKGRGLEVSNEGKLKWYLTDYNYQNIINGYNDFFMFNNDRKTNIYKKSINSDMIIELFNFDRSISTLLFSNILNIERKFTTLVCSEIIQQNKSKIVKLEMGKILKCSDEELKTIFTKLKKDDYKTIRDLMSSYWNNKKVTKKYWQDSNEIPIWTLCLNWTFGSTMKIFSFLDKNTQRIICNKFFPELNIANFYIYFEKTMKMLSDVRNIICHNNVLYNIDYSRSKVNIMNFYEVVFKQKISSIRLNIVIEIIVILSPKNNQIQSLIKQKIQNLEKKIDFETFNHIIKYIK